MREWLAALELLLCTAAEVACRRHCALLGVVEESLFVTTAIDSLLCAVA